MGIEKEEEKYHDEKRYSRDENKWFFFVDDMINTAVYIWILTT